MILEHRQYRLYALVAIVMVAFGGAAFGLGRYYNLIIPDRLLAVVLSGLLAGLLLAARAIARVGRDNRAAAGVLAEPAAMLENTGAGIFSCDPAGVVTSVNSAGARLFGYSPQELLGKQFAGLLLADVMIDQSKFFEQYVAAGNPGSAGAVHQLAGRRRDGARLPMRLSVNEFETAGATNYVVVVYADTALRGMERGARPSAAQMDEAAACITFLGKQLRAPVDDVINELRSLRDAELPPQHRQHAALAYEASMSLLQAIDHVLDWNTMESGRVVLTSKAFNLRQLVHGVIGPFRSQALAKGIGLTCQYGDGLPPMLVGDAARLRQVMTNLLDNAFKYTDQGEVKITVDIDAQAGESCQVCFTVQDTGIGIGAEDLPLLFTPYCQTAGSVAESTAGNVAGVGLGLALTHKLVSLMGGDIDVRAAPDQGAIFTVSLPLTAATVSAVPHCQSEAAADVRPHIGVVCSNGQGAGNNVAACVALIPDAMYFSEDSDVEILDVAQQLVAQGRLDLLVIYRRDTDASMTLAREVRACTPLLSVAVLVLADQGNPGHSRTARDLGLAGFLTQPFDHGSMQRCINKARTGGMAPWAFRYRLDEYMSHDLPRLLVAEDNRVNQKVVVNLLEEMGISVDVVANGEAAVAAAATNAYPLILMDCRMPGVDGYEATERIRKQEGGRPAIIIAMTASAMAGDRERCLRAGMDDYIEKPLELRVLKQKLSYWLQDKPVSFSSTGS